jgi:hypothetical protein
MGRRQGPRRVLADPRGSEHFILFRIRGGEHQGTLNIQDEEPVATADERGVSDVGLPPKHFSRPRVETSQFRGLEMRFPHG